MAELTAILPWAFVAAIAATLTAIALAIANHMDHAKAVHKLQIDVRSIRRDYAERIAELHRREYENSNKPIARIGSARITDTRPNEKQPGSNQTNNNQANAA